MTHLKFVGTGEAEGLVKEVYEAMSQGAAGQVPPLMQTLSLNPEGLAGFEKFYHAISAGGSTLGRRREEMIATAVSAWNGCWY
ncbi:MAG: carboxymuconolactone decarboxylase family protein [SAR324 cluster bacterium]|nr:carboxymuconolactone decarboxylase family protein [SAR324 cluster bacterium]